MKKIKNPDKYIRRLKAEIKRHRQQERDAWGVVGFYKGQCLISWADSVIDDCKVTDTNLGQLRVGDKIAVTGIITKVLEFQSDKGVACEITYRRVQTKKVERI